MANFIKYIEKIFDIELFQKSSAVIYYGLTDFSIYHIVKLYLDHINNSSGNKEHRYQYTTLYVV